VVDGGSRASKIIVGFGVIINSNEKMFLISIGGGGGGTLTCSTFKAKLVNFPNNLLTKLVN